MAGIPQLKYLNTREKVSEAEWETRVDLAAFYRLVAHYGMTDLIYNHITARVPGRDHEILINPYGLFYDEITASSLVKIDLDGNVLHQPDPEHTVNVAGYVIHSAIHAARHDIACVAHTHTESGIAVASLKCGLLPLNQTGMQILSEVGYHDFEGPAVDTDERSRLVADLGDKLILILRNHGLLACGRTIPQAFRNLYFLENACRAQMRAMAANAELQFPSEAAQRKTLNHFTEFAKHKRPQDAHGGLEWRALRRKLDKLDASYCE